MSPTFDGRPLSDTNRVNDLRDDDQLPIVRPSEPLPQDQNAHMSGGRVKQLLGGATSGPAGPSVNLYAGPGTHTDGAMTQKAATEYADRGPNLRPDGFKSVRFLTRTDPRFDQASDHALDELDTLLGCIGTRCFVEFAEKHYVLRFDGAPRPGGPGTGPQCWRDGHMQFPTPLVPARWVAEDSASAQVKDYSEYPAGFDFPADTFISAYVPGQSSEQFFKRRTPGGPAPAPTAGGDATYWRLQSATDVPMLTQVRLTATTTEADFLDRLENAQLGTYAGQRLYVTRAANDTLSFVVTGNAAFAGEDAQAHDANNPDAPAVAVSVRVANGAFVVGPRSAGGAAFVAWAAGVAIVKGQGLYNSAGVSFYALDAIANPQAEPFLSTSSTQANALYVLVGGTAKADKIDGKVPEAQLPIASATALGMVRTRRGFRITLTGLLDTTAVDYVTEVPVTLNTDTVSFGAVVGLAYRVNADATTGSGSITLAVSDATQNGRIVAVRNVGATQPFKVFNPDNSLRDTLAPGDYAWYVYRHPAFETVLCSGGGSGSQRDIYKVTQAERNTAKGLFTGGASQVTAVATNYTDATAPYGVRFLDSATGRGYELMPDFDNRAPNGDPTPTWIRPL